MIDDVGMMSEGSQTIHLYYHLFLVTHDYQHHRCVHQSERSLALTKILYTCNTNFGERSRALALLNMPLILYSSVLYMTKFDPDKVHSE